MVSTYSEVSSAAGEGLASETRSGGSVGSQPVAIIKAENPLGFVWHSVESQHNPGHFIDPGFGRGSFQ